ncbi:MAG: AAA family ATPase [Chloroflexi bacterium]|nr:AAA family ATPase [Chloroflexota bacterium]
MAANNTTFQFHIFGPPRLYIGQQTVDLPPQPAAFCSFLVLNRQRRITREEVQTAFWPDAAPARSQERLRRTLYLLRRAVEPHTYLVASEGAELAIAPEANLWVDYEAFETLLLNAYRRDPPIRQPLEEAVALYTDDLLKDIYADWVLLEREHARQRFLTALRQLIGVCRTENDWAAVIRYAHRLIEYDPFQEVAHRALMTAYASTGDRSAALRQYQQCVQILRDDMGADPLPETTQLYEDIRQGRGVTSVEIVPAAAKPDPVMTDLRTLPLVGRDHELGEIAAEWRICRSGNSRLVLVTGPAGMGKTRLVAEAIARLPGTGVTVITGNCYAMEAGTPYQLIADLMRKAAGLVWDQLSPAVRSDLLPLVPALLTDDRSEAGNRSPVTLDNNIRLQEAVTQVIRQLAAQGEGLWLVSEDLHWADPASLACLNHALRRCSDLPLMVLATLRDEEVSFDSPLMDWPTSSVHAPAPTTLIQLPPLEREQLDHLLEPFIEQDTSPLAALVYSETAGNPLFIVETLRALIQQGVLYSEPGKGWRVRSDGLSQSRDLPVSDVVLRLIRGRIRRLSRAAQEVLTVAAVIEHDIDERLLRLLVDPSLSLDLALDEILHAFVVAETAPGLYQFTHIKVREVLYADISTPRRRFLHRRIAEILAQQGKNERLADISRLAYHHTQAREWTLALLHGWRAALTAWDAGALAEAHRYAEVAQNILDQYQPELDPAALPESLAAIRFDLLALRAEFRRRAATAGLYYPPDLLDEISILLPQLDHSRQARASLQQAVHSLGKGDLAAARETAGRGRTFYARVQDRGGELDAVQHQIDIAYRAGEMVTVRRLLDEFSRLAAQGDTLNIHQVLAGNEMRLAVYNREWMRVLQLAQELTSSQQRQFDPAVAWLSLADLGLAYMNLGNYEQAYTVALRAVAASEDAQVLGLGARVLLARLELGRGSFDVARSILLDLLETPDPLIGESEVVSPALALVRCCVAVGDVEEARRWAKRASQAVSLIRLPILYPLSQVAWALARLVAGRYDEARKRLSYPLEWMSLIEDISPQEIFVLRAAAAQGINDQETARTWLDQAHDTIHQQSMAISEPLYRESFLSRIPLHRFVDRALVDSAWKPQDIFNPLVINSSER